MLKFQPDILRARLSQLSKRQRVAFAVCCAVRQFKDLSKFLLKYGNSRDLQVFRNAIEFAVSFSVDEAKRSTGSAALLQKCIKAAPKEDDAYEHGFPYAADAARAVIHSLTQIEASEPLTEPALSAAQTCFDIANDKALEDVPDGLISISDEEKILASDPVQTELILQDADLRQIETLNGHLETLMRSKVSTLLD